MYKLDVPVELKEAAVLQKREYTELQRKNRVFNATVRTIGVDNDALATQVREKNTREEKEKARHDAFYAQILQNDKIACLLDERQKEDIKNLNKAIDEFRRCFQKKEDSKEFDIHDPNALKKDVPARIGVHDPHCSVSGVQILMGEDIKEMHRINDQKEQLREWLLQQQRELQKAIEEKKFSESLYNKHMAELTAKAIELEKMEDKARRNVCIFTKEYNKAQAEQSLERKKLEKQLEEEDNSVEIWNHIEGDLLCENPEQATSAFGPHRIIPNRWKGMTSNQREELNIAQQQQIKEKMRLKEEEKQNQAEWDRRRVQEDKAMVLIERQQRRQEKELLKEQAQMNLQLAQAQKAHENYMNKEVFTNPPTDAYFEQFNSSNR